MGNIISHINLAEGDLSVNELLNREKNFKILLADDDSDDRELFKEAVEELKPSITISTTEDGIELMNLLCDEKEQQPDLIFLDLNMPLKSGKKCLEEIKSNPKYAHIIVIIYSTSSNHKDIDGTYNMGANLYLCKPNSYTQLLELIKTVFSLPIKEYYPKVLKKDFVLKAGLHKIAAHD